LNRPRFDADERLANLARPAIKLGGRVYVGRLLSIEEWEPFEERMEALKNKTMSEPSVREFFREYGHTIFARRWWERWKGDPTDRLLREAPIVQLEAFVSFWVAQQRAMRPSKATAQTSGSS
jgi:hypothetical protein